MRGGMFRLLALAFLVLMMSLPSTEAQLRTVKPRFGSVDRASDLADRRKASPTGVLSFDGRDWEAFGTTLPKPYTLVINMHANEMAASKPFVKKIHDEFHLAGEAFKKQLGATGPDGEPHPRSKSIFFVELELSSAREAFQQLSVQSLPFLFVMRASKGKEPSGAIVLSPGDKMELGSAQLDAEHIAKWVAQVAGLPIPPIARPTFREDPWYPVYVTAAALSLLAAVYAVFMTPFFRNQTLQCVACLAVYLFAVSGGFYGIIRGVPVYVTEASGAVRFFGEHNGQTLGGEGFWVGSMYLIVAALLVALPWAAMFMPASTSSVLNRVLLYAVLLATAIAVQAVFSKYRAKTGYNYRVVGWD